MYDAKDYETRIWWSAEDAVFVAQCVEMPGVMAHGDTRGEAAASIQGALEAMIEVNAERPDVELPPPARLSLQR